MEAPENQSERALMKGGCTAEVNGNLLEDGFDDLEEREGDEDYFQDENSIGSEVLLTEVEKGVNQEKMETSQGLRNCPIRQSKALLKERLYLEKGSIQRQVLLKESTVCIV